jgi:hypothetical protein
VEIGRRDPGPSWTETVVKAGLAAAPFVGGPLATLVDDMATRHWARVTEFAQVTIETIGDPEALVIALQQTERVADMFFQGAIAASTTSDERKRRAMGLVVGQAAAGDDVRIEESQLLLDALRDLDASSPAWGWREKSRMQCARSPIRRPIPWLRHSSAMAS